MTLAKYGHQHRIYRCSCGYIFEECNCSFKDKKDEVVIECAGKHGTEVKRRGKVPNKEII